jgi:2-keto-4-pentenoate hydratase/2-oxohepta-3-ene-1,7-dioic acid hydratase in catechol pathway
VNVAGRAALDHEGGWYDLARLSGDPALADPSVAVARHRELHRWQEVAAGSDPDGSLAEASLGPPVPGPRQVFGIGLNYRDHAAETNATLPPAPLVFTKFPSCIAGPRSEVPLSGPMVDWEVEIVVVIGTECRNVPVADAWSVVAGLTLGQDVSDRAVQFTGTPAQFCLGKSFPAYGPCGPALVSPDAFSDPDDVGLWCEVNGERVQSSRTSALIFPVPVLVAYLSSICTLWPGDLVFSGTPAGVGMARGRFLAVGDVVTSGAEVIGELCNRCVAGTGPLAVGADGSAGPVGL